MLIGLWDDDLYCYNQTIFNLELMKLAAYYKRKKEVTVFAPRAVPEKYSRFIFRKDFNDGYFPDIIRTAKNLEYGGHAFSGERYVPLPMDIELTPPDKLIYQKFKDNYSNTKTLQQSYQTLVNAEHFRLSLDGKTVWKDLLKPTNITRKTFCYMFHDYDLNKIENASEAIQEIVKRGSQGLIKENLGCKFPIQASTPQDLFKWSDFRLMNNFYLQYNGLMEDEAFYELVVKERARTICRRINYYVTTGCSSENDFVIRVLPQIFNQATFSRNNHIIISLKYEDNFFVDKRWEEVVNLINAYLGTIKNVKIDDIKRMNIINEYNSLYAFVSSFDEDVPQYKTRMFTKQKARELFQFVRERNYEVFKDFYAKSKVELKGGQFVNGTTKH